MHALAQGVQPMADMLGWHLLPHVLGILHNAMHACILHVVTHGGAGVVDAAKLYGQYFLFVMRLRQRVARTLTAYTQCGNGLHGVEVWVPGGGVPRAHLTKEMVAAVDGVLSVHWIAHAFYAAATTGRAADIRATIHAYHSIRNTCSTFQQFLPCVIQGEQMRYGAELALASRRKDGATYFLKLLASNHVEAPQLQRRLHAVATCGDMHVRGSGQKGGCV